MIDIKVKLALKMKAVKKAAREANHGALKITALNIRQTAQRSIKKRLKAKNKKKTGRDAQGKFVKARERSPKERAKLSELAKAQARNRLGQFTKLDTKPGDDEPKFPDRRPSPVGDPPRTRNKALRRAILFSVEDDFTAVVGTKHGLAGNVGKAHEHGGTFKRQKFKPRPFMRPALAKEISKLPKKWRNSIKS